LGWKASGDKHLLKLENYEEIKIVKSFAVLKITEFALGLKINELSNQIIGAAILVQKALGPVLFDSI